MQVKELMTTNVHAVSANATVRQAAEAMAQTNIGALPVARDRELVGMLTDRDIVVRVLGKGLDPDATTTGQAMSPEVFTLPETEDVAQASQRMRQKQVRRAPVLNESGQLVGIVALADFALKSGDTALSGDLLKGVSTPDTKA